MRVNEIQTNKILANGIEIHFYLSGVLHVVVLAGAQSRPAGRGGAALLGATQHDGVLVEVARPLHRHRHRARLLRHVVTAAAKRRNQVEC